MHYVQRKGALHERLVVCCIRRGKIEGIGGNAYKELVIHLNFLSNATVGCQVGVSLFGDFVGDVGLLPGRAILQVCSTREVSDLGGGSCGGLMT